MNTLLLNNNEKDIQKAGEILAKGGLVGIPTETVYGLAADALNGKAVEEIFKDSKKGDKASDEAMNKIFETTDPIEVSRIILEK